MHLLYEEEGHTYLSYWLNVVSIALLWPYILLSIVLFILLQPLLLITHCFMIIFCMSAFRPTSKTTTRTFPHIYRNPDSTLSTVMCLAIELCRYLMFVIILAYNSESLPSHNISHLPSEIIPYVLCLLPCIDCNVLGIATYCHYSLLTLSWLLLSCHIDHIYP